MHHKNTTRGWPGTDNTENVTMAYDGLNRNTSWTDGTNAQTQIYRGAEWIRCGASENGTLTKFQYDKDNVFADINSSGTVTTNYVTPFLDQNVMMVDNAGQTLHITTIVKMGLGVSAR